MLFKDAVGRLEQAMARQLPGTAAHAPLSPVPRRQWPADFDPANLRHAAGLLLVYPSPTGSAPVAGIAARGSNQAHILLTVRAGHLGRHGGQVSLPGGAIDPGETFEEAALREAHEEVGLAREQVRVLGRLTALDIPVSGFRLHPIVGACDRRPPLTPSDGEVARILDVDVEDLLAPDCVVHTPRTRDGISHSVPGFHVQGVEIWGATAMVLAEFLSLLGWSAGPAL